MLTNTLELITPEKAEAMLARSNNPRPLLARHVADFVRHLESNSFRTTHQGIAFDLKGFLVDGQHRLHAIMKAGREVQMFVARGLDPQAVLATDRGDRRNDSVVLNCHPWCAQVITAATILATSLTRPTESQLIAVRKALLADAELLQGFCASARKSVTTANIKLGAVMNMTGDPDYVCEQYRALVLMQFDKQSPAVKWFTARLISERKITAYQTLAYAFRVFNPANRAAKKITMKNPSLYLEEIRASLRAAAGLSGDPLPALRVNGE